MQVLLSVARLHAELAAFIYSAVQATLMAMATGTSVQVSGSEHAWSVETCQAKAERAAPQLAKERLLSPYTIVLPRL